MPSTLFDPKNIRFSNPWITCRTAEQFEAFLAAYPRPLRISRGSNGYRSWIDPAIPQYPDKVIAIRSEFRGRVFLQIREHVPILA